MDMQNKNRFELFLCVMDHLRLNQTNEIFFNYAGAKNTQNFFHIFFLNLSTGKVPVKIKHKKVQHKK